MLVLCRTMSQVKEYLGYGLKGVQHLPAYKQNATCSTELAVSVSPVRIRNTV